MIGHVVCMGSTTKDRDTQADIVRCYFDVYTLTCWCVCQGCQTMLIYILRIFSNRPKLTK